MAACRVMNLFQNLFSSKILLKSINIFILVISFCPFSFGKKVDGRKLYLENSDPDYHLAMGLIDPEGEDLKDFPEIQSASRMLVLGDGFEQKWTQIAEKFHKVLFNPIEIYKTDIKCPKDLDGKNTGNLYFQYLNHKACFPFASKFFDLIVMRYGLCTCQRSTETCGGIVFKGRNSKISKRFFPCFQKNELVCSDQQAFQFFYEVSRVLNDKNPDSLAFLHGPSYSRVDSELDYYEHQKFQVLLTIIPRLEKEFPLLDFKLLYMHIKGSFVFQGAYIRTRIHRYLN